MSWVVDVTPPAAVHLDSTPELVTNQTQAGFGYTGEPGGIFECRLDQEAFAACPNPKSYEALPAGAHEFFVRQVDDAGNAGEPSRFAWSIDTSAPAAPSISSAPSSPSTERSASIAFQGEAGGRFECSLDGEPENGCDSPAEYQDLTEGLHTFSAVQIDDAGNRGEVATTTWEVVPDGQAPPLEQNGVVPFEDQVSFLYSGANPVQEGVAPGVIERRRVAVVRGLVKARDGGPIGGARIDVVDHPEYGYTTTNADGIYSMAVNGGGGVRLHFSLDGYLPAERDAETTWNDYDWAADTALVPLSTEVAQIDLSTPLAPAQVAQGPIETDQDGSRRATLIFNAGTQATMTTSGGEMPLSNLAVRATEYTVGPDGPAAMPFPLPPTSAYTYAIDYTVDEALATGASSVNFSRPVITYTDNFLGFAVGERIPNGYLDPKHGEWVADGNGVVVKMLSESGGIATLEVDGSGGPGDPRATRFTRRDTR